MLTKQLQKTKEYLEGLTSLSDGQKELLHELNFLDENEVIKKEIDEKYRILKKIFESFSVAKSNCPTCGKKL